MTAALIALLGCIAGCVTPSGTECADGILCPAGKVCAPEGGACVDPTQVVACTGLAEGVACELVGIGTGACRDGVCVVAGCGDGVVDAGEQCDDGNDVDADACTNACTSAVCGDGVQQPTEACDDGAANGEDRACTSDCALARCGDGLVQAGVEACDLGAGNADGGACTTACAAAVCGDGLTWLGVEGCDDGNDVDEDGCRTSCALPTCGDGVQQLAEGCDDGAGNGDDRACTSSCQLATCGDGKVQLGVEDCDTGVANAGDAACTLACRANVCGDGGVWAGVEACDDGNAESGDGCRRDCTKIEVCGDAIVDAGEACDDGVAGLPNPADGCDACVATAWRAAALVGAAQAGTEIGLDYPVGVVVDRTGNIFIADSENHRIRRIDAATGAITTVAGTGGRGFSGDGGAATSAQLAYPQEVAVDGAGSLFIADLFNHRIRRVAAGTGIITTVAGTGVRGFSGDGGAATSATLDAPQAVAVDGLGNLFIADRGNERIRRVAANTGIITTVAGTGVSGFGGDGAAATTALLASPSDVEVDGAGNLFIVDRLNHRIRRVAGATGVISTVAGSAASGADGDGALATSAQLNFPAGVTIDVVGNLFIADARNRRVRRVDRDTGIISTVAGSGDFGAAGDGGPALGAQLGSPVGVDVDAAGNLFIADDGVHRVRRVDSGSGIIETIAGTEAGGGLGDGGAATSAPLGTGRGIAVDASGNLFIANASLQRVSRVDAMSGVIVALAGTGEDGTAGDGGASTAAQLSYPQGVAVDNDGNVFIAEIGSHRIRRVDAATGSITTVAGSGASGYAGDGGAATSAQLAYPSGVAVDEAGNVFIADTNNHRIRRVDAVTGLISTVAGSGTAGTAGDGGAATSAQLTYPEDVAVDRHGNLFVADTWNRRIRRIDAATTVISTVAGTGGDGFGGDGGPAVDALLSWPVGVEVDELGELYIADALNGRIRRVAAGTGVITTVVGTGGGGVQGDGGVGTSAHLSYPTDVVVDGGRNIFVADNRVRRIDATTGTIVTVAGPVAPERLGPLGQAALALPVAVAYAPEVTLFAGGATGTLQALRPVTQWLEVVAGRYPQPVSTGALAKFRDTSFGTVGGVAFDATLGRIYLTETTAHRLHVVTVTDLDDEDRWTIATLAGDPSGSGTAAFVDGPAAAARFDSPTGLFFDDVARVLYVADTGNHVVRALPIDLAGVAGDVSTMAGTPRTLGYFGDGGAATAALLYGPEAITRCGNGDLFIADTTNQRVRRVAAGTGIITTVLGDGVAASSGQGHPAIAFPVDTPKGLACDPFGNLVVTSRTAVRLVVADAGGVVDGRGSVQTIYGEPPRTEYPASVTTCLTGVAVVDGETVQATDSCTGVLVELWRQPLP